MEKHMIRASDRVRELLEEEICQGALRPGDTIDEKMLTERFQVSRTPAREAIMQLAATGLVQMKPRHGAVVSELSVDEAIAMLEALACLETEAAGLAAERIRPDELEALTKIHSESEDAARRHDSKQYMVCNAQFHAVLYDGCHNPYLAELIRQTRSRLAYYHVSSLTQRARIERSWVEHGNIVRAIEKGDPSKAQSAMRDHILSGGRVYADLVAIMSQQKERTDKT
jgi:DNA-binding GntR family transcriptional regulator